jgi:hypothetical protein
MCGLCSSDNNNFSMTDRTESQVVRYQFEDLSRSFLEVVLASQETIDFCVDSRGLSFLLSDESLWKAIIGSINKGIRSRFITNITNENISYCNVLMKYSSELFHEDRVKGNFLIVDGRKYLFFVADVQEEKERRQKQIINQLLYNEVKLFVDAQQYLFDNLCSNAIPARDKIREIGKAVRGDFIDTLRNPTEIQKTAINLLESATYEILVLFSTINSFHRAEYNGILNSLLQASQRGVMVKMLIRAEDHNNHQLSETLQKKIRQKHLPINIQYITKPLQNKITTLVIDQTVSLAIEANDDDDDYYTSKKTSNQSTTTATTATTAVAIYSNNESTVSSCISIFETLWIQSEFDKQKKAKQAYFQMFRGFNLKDEIYTRRWSFSGKIPNKEYEEKGRQKNSSKADSRT